MTLALLLMAAGAALLAFSGDKLVDFASALASRARVSPAVIGLTVVAAGTSTPELFVSVAAALGGSPAIALGNVVGSNIANIGLILAAAALFAPLPFAAKLLKFEYPFLVLASWFALLLCRDGVLDRLEGGFFVVSVVAFTAYSVWVARREVGPAERESIGELVPRDAGALSARGTGLLLAGLLASFAGLALGARWLVAGAIEIATALGLSERVIGLTLVAVGTSLPELVASVAATLKGRSDLAVTNVIGSNIFNILMILGVTALLRPVDVPPAAIHGDLWVMLAFAVAPLPIVVSDRQLRRPGALVLLAAYAAYVATLVW